MNSFWLIIWRFQPLHLGHELLIESSLKENQTTLILIWSVNKEDSQNPYSYQDRKKLIESIYSRDISIWDLPDFPGDQEWIKYILWYIPLGTSQVVLYCWDIKNDSAVKSLKSSKIQFPFILNIKEIPRSIIPVSASQVREWISRWDSKKLQKYLSKKTLLSLGI